MARKVTARVEIRAEDHASQAVGKAQGSFAKFGSFLKDKFVITLGDVARAFSAAMATIKQSADLASQTNALKAQLAQQGQAYDAFIAKLDEVAKGTVSTADLIKSSSQALLLGIPAEQISELLEVARVSAIATGQSVSDAFRDIATGIGRASPMILDNLGLMVKLGPAYEEYARQIGKSVEQLTAQEQKQALLNEVLRIGKGRVEAYGDAASGAAEKIQQGAAAMDNLKIAAGNLTTGLVSTFVVGLQAVALTVSVAWEGTVKLAKAVSELAERIPFLGKKFEGLTDWLYNADDAMDTWQQSTAKSMYSIIDLGKESFKAGLGIDDNTKKVEANTTAVSANTKATQENVEATVDVASVSEDSAAALDRLTEAQQRLQYATEATTQAIAVQSQVTSINGGLSGESYGGGLSPARSRYSILDGV